MHDVYVCVCMRQWGGRRRPEERGGAAPACAHGSAAHARDWRCCAPCCTCAHACAGLVLLCSMLHMPHARSWRCGGGISPLRVAEPGGAGAVCAVRLEWRACEVCVRTPALSDTGCELCAWARRLARVR